MPLQEWVWVRALLAWWGGGGGHILGIVVIGFHTACCFLQPTNPPTNQPTNPPTNQPTNQPAHLLPPVTPQAAAINNAAGHSGSGGGGGGGAPQQQGLAAGGLAGFAVQGTNVARVRVGGGGACCWGMLGRALPAGQGSSSLLL